MTAVVAAIAQSLDGYVTGPDDGPGKGLGEGGERLHYWVFNGPWSYGEAPPGEAASVDKEILDEGVGRSGAIIGGRSTYDAAAAWGGEKDVGIMGGADTIRQALAAGHVDELIVTIAPVILGAGKRLFESFDQGVELEQVDARQSRWATHLRYRVVKK
ncbi:dihydrofolate reductase family protein [Pseudonocardia asaccharolytica]|uniref:Bacterial bifunctional deaminase-reductase C-terminal domain-containing protein n=1 Tax=Pseudonocardia asaccharolytica DSM 44247 = NBRC 16224 TaxID=1123024 RepID=A0A511D4D4_9PSEU|nr:dihydrofolate reductase family protein [Pseudonocardia asaccharolytica]GEL18454.1 hypothetical protein PA7_22910 [Pseudonocardia asaccharolytica DSM 44247 = NBRC 16224]